MTEDDRELDLQLADALDEIKELRNQIERLKGHIHTCGPTCSKAGCVNQRLRAAAQAGLEYIEEVPCDPSSAKCLGKDAIITQLQAALEKNK